MTLGWAAVQAGIGDEDVIGARFHAAGWGVTRFGQWMWDPRTNPAHGRPGVIDAVRATTRWPIRHAPDLLVGRDPGGVLLVEVVRNRHEEKRCMEVEKLLALDAWVAIAPVVIVDVQHLTAWKHHPMWAGDVISDVSRFTRTGSGDGYAWFTRAGERDLEEVLRDG